MRLQPALLSSSKGLAEAEAEAKYYVRLAEAATGG